MLNAQYILITFETCVGLLCLFLFYFFLTCNLFHHHHPYLGYPPVYQYPFFSNLYQIPEDGKLINNMRIGNEQRRVTNTLVDEGVALESKLSVSVSNCW